MDHSASYLRALKNKLIVLEAQESEMYNRVKETLTDEAISNLNSLRVQILTIESRIKNINRQSSIEEFVVVEIRNNETYE